MIRLVVSDVDGTMLDETEIIPEKIKNLAALIDEKGIFFTIASGREYSQVQQLEAVLDIKTPIIMCNGAAARHHDEFSWCDAIPANIVKRITEQADAGGMTVILSTPEDEYSYRLTEFVKQTIITYGRFGSLLELPEGGWKNLSVQKILIIDKERNHSENYNRLLNSLEGFGEEITWTDYGQSIDIVPKGCTKAAGVIRLADILGIDMREVMTIGDSYNDLEMISEAGVGVAVNNAVDSLKTRADYICEGKYLDGVIEAIRCFC